MASGQSFNSHGTTASVVSAPKPPDDLSPATYYQDPRRRRRQRHWHIAIFVLHCIAGCLAWSLLIINLNMIPVLRYFLGQAPFFGLFPAALSAFWTTAELLTLLCRRDLARGIDARWQLSIHLVLWCGCAVVAAFVSMVSRLPIAHYYDSNSTRSFADHRGVINLSTLVVLTLIHFVLFVRYCIQVNRHNSEKQVNRVFTALTRLNMHGRDPGVVHPDSHRHTNPPPHAPPPPAVQRGSANHSIELPQIPRRPVGAPPPLSTPPAGTMKNTYRVLDPEVEANLKFMGPLPVESRTANLKYPSRALRKA
ncbi:hypothetical protein MN608_05756 [Microdochium nivale]|nr:hypothetical protein MN608_05756 [Microdochium nivale]